MSKEDMTVGHYDYHPGMIDGMVAPGMFDEKKGIEKDESFKNSVKDFRIKVIDECIEAITEIIPSKPTIKTSTADAWAIDDEKTTLARAIVAIAELKEKK